jgi:hypothetical protein
MCAILILLRVQELTVMGRDGVSLLKDFIFGRV